MPCLQCDVICVVAADMTVVKPLTQDPATSKINPMGGQQHDVGHCIECSHICQVTCNAAFTLTKSCKLSILVHGITCQSHANQSPGMCKSHLYITLGERGTGGKEAQVAAHVLNNGYSSGWDAAVDRSSAKQRGKIALASHFVGHVRGQPSLSEASWDSIKLQESRIPRLASAPSAAAEHPVAARPARRYASTCIVPAVDLALSHSAVVCWLHRSNLISKTAI